MFNASGKKLIREQRNGTATEQLRAAAAIELEDDILQAKEILLRIEKQLEAFPKEAKSVQQCKGGLLKALDKLDNEFLVRLHNMEEGYERLTKTLATDTKTMVINVQPMHSQQRRAALLPSEPGLVRKKRKTAAPPDETSKRTRKKRTLKPQKVAARKASVAFKQQQAALKKEAPG